MTRFLGKLSVAVALVGVLACGEEEAGQPLPPAAPAPLSVSDLGLPPSDGGVAIAGDIVIDSMTVAPSFHPGQSPIVRLDVRNAGPGVVPASYWDWWAVLLVLSTDIYPSADDQPVGGFLVQNPWNVGTHTVFEELQIPWDQAPGVYYLFAYADYWNMRTEIIEWNNKGVRLVVVTSP